FAAGDLFAKPGYAEAAFFAPLLARDMDDLRIDEYDLLRRIFTDRAIDDGNAPPDSDLRRRQSHTLSGVHGFEHIFEEFVKLGRVELGYDLGGTLQHRVAVFHNRVDHKLRNFVPARENRRNCVSFRRGNRRRIFPETPRPERARPWPLRSRRPPAR